MHTLYTWHATYQHQLSSWALQYLYAPSVPERGSANPPGAVLYYCRAAAKLTRCMASSQARSKNFGCLGVPTTRFLFNFTGIVLLLQYPIRAIVYWKEGLRQS